MDWYGKTIRLSAATLVCAVLLRLGTAGFFDPVVELLTSRDMTRLIWFLETGRSIPATQPPQTQPPATQPTEPSTEPPAAATQPAEESLPDTTAPTVTWDAGSVQVNSYCGYTPQVEAWLEQPLDWELRGKAPTVLILHSHGTESYENTEDYQQTTPYRTQDPERNVVSVGDYLVQRLEKAGIHTLHDRQLHDHPSYSDAYENSRESVRQYLQQYPSIRLVLDLHRDAVADDTGQQLGYTVPGTDVARLMLVVGSDAGGLSHSKWPENMSLAVKLHAGLEQLLPGICRPISFRTQRFNQDLSTGALLVEVGAAGNTRQQALRAAEYLAEAIIALASGTTKSN